MGGSLSQSYLLSQALATLEGRAKRKGNKLPSTSTAGGIGNQGLKQQEEIRISHREDAVAEDREYWEGGGFPLLDGLLPMNTTRQ